MPKRSPPREPTVPLLSALIGRSRLRLIGVGILCLKIALVPVVFDYAADVPFTLIKALTSHALAFVLAGIICGLFFQFGPGFFVRSWLHIPVLAFLVANLGATLFAVDPLLALYGAHDRMLGIGTVADEALLYFGVVLLVRTPKDAVALVVSAIAGSMIVLVYEAIQLTGRDPLMWAQDSSVRPFSTLGQSTTLAAYLTVLCMGAAALAIFDRGARLKWRSLLGAYSVLALVGAVATQTRSVVLGVAAGTIALVALASLAYLRSRDRLIDALWATGPALVLTLLLFVTPLGARLSGTVELSAAEEGAAGNVDNAADAPGAPSATGSTGGSLRIEESAETRTALYRIALNMFRDRPLLGHGPDNFLASLPNYRSAHEPYEVQALPNSSTHGWLAHVVVTSGLLGLIAFLSVSAVCCFLALAGDRRPTEWAALAIVSTYAGVCVTTINAASTDELFWLGAGALAATHAYKPKPEAASSHRGSARLRGAMVAKGPSAPSTPSRWALTVLSVAVGVVLSFSVIGAINASHFAKASLVARLQSRSQQAVDLAIQATAADPRRAQYWDSLGLAYVAVNRIRDSVQAFEQASLLAPYEVRYDNDLARALATLAQQGDVSSGARAREIADRAVKTDPNNPLANLTRAVVMLITKDLSEAVFSIQRALELDRVDAGGRTSNRDIYVTAALIFNAGGRQTDAIDVARRGISRMPSSIAEVPIRIELSRALAASGQLTEALFEIDRALAIQPNHPAAHQLRTEIQAALAR